MRTAGLDGVHLHYECDGDGSPLLVLHGGLGIDHHLYRRTLAPLADDFRLLLPDQRGNGRSVPVDPETITIEQLADDAAALLDHLELDRVTVFGHSFGGFVAQELALRHSERLDGLVLACTTPGQLGTGEDPSAHQGPEPPPDVLAAMATIPESDEEMARGMATLFPAYFHRPERFDLAELLRGTRFRAATMVRGFELLASWSAVDRLPSIDVPTLVIAGRHDVFTAYPQAHRIAERIPGATTLVFEHSGHFPWIEEPDHFWSSLRSWHGTTARRANR
jgi:proline iminopeptidase